MSHKGSIQLLVEIDYDKMLTEDKIEAISGFTGVDTVEGLMNLHINQIGDALKAVVKDKPHIKFHLDGQFIPVQEENLEDMIEPAIEALPVEEAPYLEGMTDEDTDEMPDDIEEDDVDEVDSLPHQNLEESEAKELMQVFEDTIEQVAIEMGNPLRIKVNDRMHNIIADSVSALLGDTDTENNIIKKFKGFPVEIEAMEEPYFIVYKDYLSNEEKTYTKH